ncbi:PaaI family thioesterase [Aeoliella sp. ICT_H6.2]|uniref:Acyl-coenzyme A thioesterase THEM4 n=1 Tax=Aeoliella straminimaris TaxID=2954799 RepID=A0A9X2F643_9BACT|nr:PaaI family thioesterase [Aeoliella straminimaris]MCO6042322.1 PaaI family thioesterase [Aeoliella straminimaris]
MDTLNQLRSLHHGDCVVCGDSHEHGLKLQFRVTNPHEVSASFDCDEAFQGYANMLHGGVISGLLDGAMTNCLFAQGHVAVTGELRVKFRHPVATASRATIRAWIVENRPPYYLLNAELTQEGQLKAKAEGKFIERPAA